MAPTPAQSNAEIYQEYPDLAQGQIRLLQIEPISKVSIELDDSDGRLKGLYKVQCKLGVVSLSDHPEYIALSYTWGPPIYSEECKGEYHEANILCNGKKMSVRKNLYDFLLHCAQAEEDDPLLGPLWIDAIAINQANLPERSHQVNRMAEIYKEATKVVVWLGEEEKSTPKAFALVEKLANASAEQRAGIHPYQVSRNSTDPLLNFENWQALARLFQRSWFDRVWIIQEVTNTERWYHVPTRLSATKITWSSAHRDGLLYALIRARPSSSQDPRDKVYSQLGIGGASIFPSYERSVAEVYITTAKYIFKHSDNLFLLTCVEGEEFQHIPGLPSWVPDWSCTKFLGLRITGYHAFTAAGDRPRRCYLQDQDETNIIGIEATKIDEIVKIGETKGDTYTFANPDKLWRLIQGLDETYFTGEKSMMPAERITKYPASKTLEVSFHYWIVWKYVVTSINQQRRPTLFPTLTSSPNTILPSKGDILTALDACEKNPNELKDLAHRASHFDVHYMHGMLLRPFRTKQGFFGLGTQALREGNSVWVVSGCRVPLILRKVENSSRYRLVGGTYLHGFMDGEVLKKEGTVFKMVELE
ncbi:HET-domain-containing protein [Byssothecium circinans]|uniref:HET-domain-containing protein n=1 Tax=Byssothecium circinans TaxID=147558 RepID=A0A6A5TE68_9PLEO|nr:HET-domain-containing protein [Byssothecium circinans]